MNPLAHMRKYKKAGKEKEKNKTKQDSRNVDRSPLFLESTLRKWHLLVLQESRHMEMHLDIFTNFHVPLLSMLPELSSKIYVLASA